MQGNGEALRRTVQNLVKNALEHGGREIAFALFQRDGAAGFRCTNQVDRPEEIDVHQVFRRFYKADAARTHTSTGLGLGLTERMGGTIGAALEGNTFSVTVTFPLAGPPEGEAE